MFSISRKSSLWQMLAQSPLRREYGNIKKSIGYCFVGAVVILGFIITPELNPGNPTFAGQDPVMIAHWQKLCVLLTLILAGIAAYWLLLLGDDMMDAKVTEKLDLVREKFLKLSKEDFYSLEADGLRTRCAEQMATVTKALASLRVSNTSVATAATEEYDATLGLLAGLGILNVPVAEQVVEATLGIE